MLQGAPFFLYYKARQVPLELCSVSTFLHVGKTNNFFCLCHVYMKIRQDGYIDVIAKNHGKKLNLDYLTSSVSTCGKCIFVMFSARHNFLSNFVKFDQYSQF